jgi:alginate O-acetyltransferase complex protein AlgI
MDSASIQFLAFGLAAVLVSNVSRSSTWRSVVLMSTSVVFVILLAQRVSVLVPLLGFLALGYGVLALLQRGHSRLMVWSIVTTVLAYAWLKKYTFLPDGVFLHAPYFTLGLSYIFFRVLHLLIEAGEGTYRERIGVGAYLLYNLNFTTFVSGPIQRFDEFARDQFTAQPIELGIRDVGLQAERIIRGFFKVNVLATALNAQHDDAMIQLAGPLPTSAKMVAALRLAVAYPLFLYCNFSGYIDIVIAVARLLRLRLPENFNRPFSASSYLDFWSQWHMTLSNWLKTYVYNPLLMALMRRTSSTRMQSAAGVLSFFVTFFLIGIWHGRTSEFAVFGLLAGGGVSINKLWQIGLTSALGRKRYQKVARNVVYESFSRGLNYAWFALTLFWFWGGWREIRSVFGALGVRQWLGVWLAVWLAATVVLATWEWLRAAVLSLKISDQPVVTNRYTRVVVATSLAVVSFAVTVLLSQPAPAIIYRTF